MLHALSEMVYGFFVLSALFGASSVWAGVVALTINKLPEFVKIQIWVIKAQIKWAGENPAMAMKILVAILTASSVILWAVALWRGSLENTLTGVWLFFVIGQISLYVLAALRPVSVEESPLA